MVSHSMDDMARLATRLLVMSEGKLVATGTPKEIFSDSAMMDSIGLGVPEATQPADRLRARGYPVPEGIYRQSELQEVLLRLWKEGASC